MATTNGATCSLGITPALLELRITSKAGPVWQTTSCPDGLAAKNVVVRPEAEVVYSLHWDGRVSPDACRGGGAIAPPGNYGVEAALIGGRPAATSFAVTLAR